MTKVLDIIGANKLLNPIYKKYLWHNTHPTQIYFGGSSSGKSFAIAQRAVLDVINGRNYLVVRKTGASIAKSSFNEIREKIYQFKLQNYFRINASAFTITCLLNQSQFIFTGLDDVEKVKSIRPLKGVITDIWIEEATEISENDYRQLTKRLRGISNFPKRIIMSFNPILKTHWIFKEFFTTLWQDDKQYVENDTVSILKTTYKDNIHLMPDDIQRLEAETDPYYRDVYLFGNWGILAGMVFNNWRVEDFDKEAFENYRYGLDWGFACLSGETLVDTDLGKKKLKDIKIGDKVLTRQGFKKVIHTQCNGQKEVYAVDFGNKKNIIATGDHRIFTASGWKRVDELQELETLCVNKSNLIGEFIDDIQSEQLVLKNVHIKRQLLSQKETVYDITVENGEYVANGILVHNCDPFAFVRMAIDLKRRRIYVCDEIYQTELLNDRAIPMVKKIAGAGIVYCDSAEPKSISEFRANGVNARPVKKGSGSVEQGLNFLKRFEIIVNPFCVNTIKELSTYHYKTDRATGEILPVPVDTDNHIIDALRYATEADALMRGTVKDIL